MLLQLIRIREEGKR